MPEPALRPKHKLRVPRPRRGPLRVLVGTRKGAFAIDGDEARGRFEVHRPWHLGWTCFHLVADPRRKGTLLAAVRDHDGWPTIVISEDEGERWEEAAEPPRFGKAVGGSAFDRHVDHVFWLSPGRAFEPGTWYCGTSPQGLFRSLDGGRTWRAIEGLHGHDEFDAWTALDRDRTPDGPKLHSILPDPRDADRMVVAMSSGGVLETLDGGATWARLDGGLAGDEARDPHCVVAAPTNPDRLWMQSHFGVYRMDRDEGGGAWRRTGPRDGDGAFDDAGFPIAVHPHDPDVAWIVPMDG
ncbi:MAG: glycosyl hydrolase, partial [Planctomycetota bacterium]